MSAISKPVFKLSLKELWTRIRPSRKAAYDVAEESNDAGRDFATIFSNNFQEVITYLLFTAIGALMIFYIGGYPGGVVILLADIMRTFLPGIPFDSAWLSLWIGLYFIACIGIVFIRLVLQAAITTRDEIIIDLLDKLEEEVQDIAYGKDLLTETMANLSDKLDEHKLHL